MIFRNAVPEEAEKIRRLTLASKRHWDYPEEYFTLWAEALDMDPEYIVKNMVVVAEEETELLGYVSIIEEPAEHVFKVENFMTCGGFFLDNLFVAPLHIRQGVGEKLMDVAFDWCRKRQIRRLHVLSEPNARGFYEKMGALYVGESINKLGKSLPLLIFNFLN